MAPKKKTASARAKSAKEKGNTEAGADPAPVVESGAEAALISKPAVKKAARGRGKAGAVETEATAQEPAGAIAQAAPGAEAGTEEAPVAKKAATEASNGKKGGNGGQGAAVVQEQQQAQKQESGEKGEKESEEKDGGQAHSHEQEKAKDESTVVPEKDGAATPGKLQGGKSHSAVQEKDKGASSNDAKKTRDAIPGVQTLQGGKFKHQQQRGRGSRGGRGGGAVSGGLMSPQMMMIGQHAQMQAQVVRVVNM